MTTKTTSIRLDREILNQIDDRCSDLACSRNDFIKTAIDNLLEVEDIDETKKEPKKIIVRTIPEEEQKSKVFTHGKILDDYGNVIGTF